MTNDRIDHLHPRNRVVEEATHSHLVRPQRNAQQLFAGWGPKL